MKKTKNDSQDIKYKLQQNNNKKTRALRAKRRFDGMTCESFLQRAWKCFGPSKSCYVCKKVFKKK
jgi:hypothetical protein